MWFRHLGGAHKFTGGGTLLILDIFKPPFFGLKPYFLTLSIKIINDLALITASL
ncbi:hypothetical protein MYP_838 [Sporocytophaga myxococcoides]|uniref:Uncharacterized protein n=1 Tax=Sporocytophaga myxococcoides TaxID=153721 RepID=A0A098L9I5_9BACT|nr:hypothetical protein [Sporocytophaga myxococcoides]GAL83611.1 hypothetical protein MYP_838 [Sporocytophaga myxococcoides]